MTLKTAFLMVASLTFLAGCGGPPPKKMLTVTGTISYKGQQIKTGIVKFLAPNGDFATAAIRPDGTFIMTEVVPGEQKVGYVGGPMNAGSSDGAAVEASSAKAVDIPSKFGDPQTSGATVMVSDMGGMITVELK